MAPIRLGVIGLSSRGWAAGALIPPLFHPTLSDKYTITAICTTSEQSAAASVAKYSKLSGHEIKPYYGPDGYERIAKDPNVDMVVVCVKMPLHLKLITPAIEAGKDVFVEWTPGNGLAETIKVSELVKKKRVRCLVGGQANQSAAVRKTKEILESGKIGRVLSTSVIFSASAVEGLFWGPFVAASLPYGADINNGATALTISVGHLLVALTDILGDFTEVTAAGAIRYPTAVLVDANGKPTGVTMNNPPHDQVALSGILSGKPYAEGAFVNIHCRAALSHRGEKSKGRTLFRWIIDGEDGTIELEHREEDGDIGCFIAMKEKRVLLNGEEVPWEETDLDKLGNTGKAWYEFAKEDDSGRYTTVDDAVRIHRVLEAALTSIREGKKIILT